MKQVVYRIVCIPTGKCYVGSSVCLRTRKAKHKRNLRIGDHYNTHLQNAWNKYGEENFLFEVIESNIDPDKLIEAEQYWIDTLKPEFNIRKIAESNAGLKHTEEAKQKISAGNLGKKVTGKALENLRKSFALRGPQNLTEEERTRRGERITAYNKSEKHKEVASVAGKLYGCNNLPKAHEKIRLKFDAITPQIFELRNQGLLGKEIANKLGISLITVRRKLNGKRYTK